MLDLKWPENGRGNIWVSLKEQELKKEKKREEKQYRQERISSLSRCGINLIENSYVISENFEGFYVITDSGLGHIEILSRRDGTDIKHVIIGNKYGYVISVEYRNQKKDGPFSYLFDIAGLYSTMRMENIQTELMEISDLLGGVGKGIRGYNWW